MIWGFVIYFGAGFISAVWLMWLLYSDNKPEEFTLGELLSTIGMILLGTAFGPITVMMAITETWDHFDFADVVLWKRKSIDLEKEARKRGYELKPLKGMDD